MKNFIHSLARASVYLVWRTTIHSILYTGIIFFACTVNVKATPNTNHPAIGHILPSVVITQHPSSRAACDRDNTSFSIAASGAGALTYQWQVSTNGGSNWTPVGNGSTYADATTSTLTILHVSGTMNGYQYNCIVTDNSGPLSSNAATLTVNPLPAVQVLDADKYICANGGGSISAQFFANLSYQWQVSTDGGSTWSNVSDGGVYSGASAQVLTISNGTGLDGYIYHYIATDNVTNCSATSARTILHVYQPAITLPPSNAAICTGSTVSFMVTATSPTTLTYEWQRQISGVLTPLSDDATYGGTGTNALDINGATTAMNGFRYAVYVRDSLGCATLSPLVTLNVYSSLAINTQPRDTFTCANTGLPIAFRVTMASGGGPLTYQWQTDNGSNGAAWSSVNAPVTTSSTTSVLSLPVITLAMNGYHYRVSVDGACGTVVSNEVILRVLADGTWRGTTNTEWHTASNWCGGVPTSTTDVLIPAWAPRMPEISNATITAYSRSLHIESNARLTISGGATAMSGPFNIEGTVAYTAAGDQQVLPASHGSLEINGGGNKYLQSNVAISHNLVLGGNAKLVTGTNLLTMKTGSNAISGATFNGVATSWIVTGNGNSGAGNTGLGGLQIEQVGTANGNVLYPIGATPADYNPVQLSNTGATDHFTIAVNDQVIPGATYQSGIDRTWLVSEDVPGGSNISLSLRWAENEEEPLFDRSKTSLIRSNGTAIVQASAANAATGANPHFSNAGGYTVLTQFSVSSSPQLLSAPVTSFNVQLVDISTTRLTWKTDGHDERGGFVIQKSAGAPAFTDIGVVSREPGKTIYNFTDYQLNNGINIYRLKITTPGQEAIFSKMLQVDNHYFSNHAELRPSVTNNPATTLYISLALDDRLAINVTDVLGRLYMHKDVQLGKGQHFLPLSLDRLGRGIYYIRVTGNYFINQSLLRLVKQ